MRYLLEAGLFVADLKDQDGRTPLMWAANEGNEEAVRVLLHRQDVDVNTLSSPQHGSWPTTALAWAAFNGHVATVELLLERDDIDVNLISDPESLTPLEEAAGNGHEAVVRILLKHKDLAADCQILQRSVALYVAAASDHCGSVGCFQLLLERGNVDVNYGNKYGVTPLVIAAYRGKAEVVKILLEHEDLDVSSRDEYGRTTLEAAYEWVKMSNNEYRYNSLGRYPAIIELLESFIRTRSSTG